jgi:hypothetical protein
MMDEIGLRRKRGSTGVGQLGRRRICSIACDAPYRIEQREKRACEKAANMRLLS